MSNHGRTVRIYLADGSPTGIRHAEVVNWTGQAIVCPRARIGELSNWTESQRRGLYILIGEDPETSHPMAYVGEAENVLTRLKQHATKKDFWEQVVFFTSKDDNLTKAHVKYLESRMVELALAAKRIKLENGASPTMSGLPRPDRDAMEEFLEPARILLGSLGFNFLEPVRKHKIVPVSVSDNGPLSDVTLYLKLEKRGIFAEGTVTDEGFVVANGSIGEKNPKDSFGATYAKRRLELIEQGVLAEAGEHLKFTQDVLFSSPSAAAAVVCAGSRNGRQCWKDIHGTTLAELEEGVVGAPAAPEGNEDPCPN